MRSGVQACSLMYAFSMYSQTRNLRSELESVRLRTLRGHFHDLFWPLAEGRFLPQRGDVFGNGDHFCQIVRPRGFWIAALKLKSRTANRLNSGFARVIACDRLAHKPAARLVFEALNEPHLETSLPAVRASHKAGSCRHNIDPLFAHGILRLPSVSAGVPQV